MRICPESVRVWSPRAAMMLRSAKKALLPVSPATRSRISSSVIPPNRRNSSLVTTDISLGASESFSANLDAVVTLVFDSASRSIENSLLASSSCWGPSRLELAGLELSCGSCCPKLAAPVTHSAARHINGNRWLPMRAPLYPYRKGTQLSDGKDRERRQKRRRQAAGTDSRAAGQPRATSASRACCLTVSPAFADFPGGP